MKEILEKRVQEIEQAIVNVVNQHSTLTGHLNEAKYLLQSIFKSEAEEILAAHAAVMDDSAKTDEPTS